MANFDHDSGDSADDLAATAALDALLAGSIDELDLDTVDGAGKASDEARAAEGEAAAAESALSLRMSVTAATDRRTRAIRSLNVDSSLDDDDNDHGSDDEAGVDFSPHIPALSHPVSEHSQNNAEGGGPQQEKAEEGEGEGMRINSSEIQETRNDPLNSELVVNEGETSSPMQQVAPRYWCHECKAAVPASENPETFEYDCSLCGGCFVEIIESDSDEDSDADTHMYNQVSSSTSNLLGNRLMGIIQAALPDGAPSSNTVSASAPETSVPVQSQPIPIRTSSSQQRIPATTSPYPRSHTEPATMLQHLRNRVAQPHSMTSLPSPGTSPAQRNGTASAVAAPPSASNGSDSNSVTVNISGSPVQIHYQTHQLGALSAPPPSLSSSPARDAFPAHHMNMGQVRHQREPDYAANAPSIASTDPTASAATATAARARTDGTPGHNQSSRDPHGAVLGILNSLLGTMNSNSNLFGNQGGMGGAAINGMGGARLAANPRDYAWGQGGLENIINQLFQQEPQNHNRPASKAAVAGLPITIVGEGESSTCADSDLNAKEGSTTIEGEEPSNDKGKETGCCSYGECAICKDSFMHGDRMITLSCQHCYHEDCILPWFERHSTCPVCRAQLPVSDEAFREQTQNSNASANASASSRNTESVTDGRAHVQGESGTARWRARQIMALPAGWERAVSQMDNSRGRVYYYNRQTGERRWDLGDLASTAEATVDSVSATALAATAATVSAPAPSALVSTTERELENGEGRMPLDNQSHDSIDDAIVRPGREIDESWNSTSSDESWNTSSTLNAEGDVDATNNSSGTSSTPSSSVNSIAGDGSGNVSSANANEDSSSTNTIVNIPEAPSRPRRRSSLNRCRTQ